MKRAILVFLVVAVSLSLVAQQSKFGHGSSGGAGNTGLILGGTPITGESTLTLPQGYVIEQIIAKETTGNSITGFDIGFTDGGGEIVASGSITGSDELSFNVLQRIDDFDASQILYISATNWNSSSLTLYIKVGMVF